MAGLREPAGGGDARPRGRPHLHWPGDIIMPRHRMPCHAISSHAISSHVLSPRLISSHAIIPSHLIPSRLISSRLISSHLRRPGRAAARAARAGRNRGGRGRRRRARHARPWAVESFSPPPPRILHTKQTGGMHMTLPPVARHAGDGHPRRRRWAHAVRLRQLREVWHGLEQPSAVRHSLAQFIAVYHGLELPAVA
jgi:hypothetical protein